MFGTTTVSSPGKHKAVDTYTLTGDSGGLVGAFFRLLDNAVFMAKIDLSDPGLDGRNNPCRESAACWLDLLRQRGRSSNLDLGRLVSCIMRETNYPPVEDAGSAHLAVRAIIRSLPMSLQTIFFSSEGFCDRCGRAVTSSAIKMVGDGEGNLTGRLDLHSLYCGFCRESGVARVTTPSAITVISLPDRHIPTYIPIHYNSEGNRNFIFAVMATKPGHNASPLLGNTTYTVFTDTEKVKDDKQDVFALYAPPESEMRRQNSKVSDVTYLKYPKLISYLKDCTTGQVNERIGTAHTLFYINADFLSEELARRFREKFDEMDNPQDVRAPTPPPRTPTPPPIVEEEPSDRPVRRKRRRPRESPVSSEPEKPIPLPPQPNPAPPTSLPPPPPRKYSGCSCDCGTCNGWVVLLIILLIVLLILLIITMVFTFIMWTRMNSTWVVPRLVVRDVGAIGYTSIQSAQALSDRVSADNPGLRSLAGVSCGTSAGAGESSFSEAADFSASAGQPNSPPTLVDAAPLGGQRFRYALYTEDIFADNLDVGAINATGPSSIPGLEVECKTIRDLNVTNLAVSNSTLLEGVLSTPCLSANQTAVDTNCPVWTNKALVINDEVLRSDISSCPNWTAAAVYAGTLDLETSLTAPSAQIENLRGATGAFSGALSASSVNASRVTAKTALEGVTLLDDEAGTKFSRGFNLTGGDGTIGPGRRLEIEEGGTITYLSRGYLDYVGNLDIRHVPSNRMVSFSDSVVRGQDYDLEFRNGTLTRLLATLVESSNISSPNATISTLNVSSTLGFNPAGTSEIVYHNLAIHDASSAASPQIALPADGKVYIKDLNATKVSLETVQMYGQPKFILGNTTESGVELFKYTPQDGIILEVDTVRTDKIAPKGESVGNITFESGATFNGDVHAQAFKPR